jgi:predicted ferric reductase
MDKKYIPYLVILFLALLPILYWFFILSGTNPFDNFISIVSSFGKILGLSGMILFSLTLLLSTRLKFLENIFGGLDKTNKAHHNIGTLAFLLLLFHPLFLASRYLMSSIKQAFLFLLPFNNELSITLGIIALVLMELFLIITFFFKIKYNYWLFSHTFLGLSFIIASMHVLLISSDVSRDIFLSIYFIIFIIIGICSFFYRTILWRFLIKRYYYKT